MELKACKAPVGKPGSGLMTEAGRDSTWAEDVPAETPKSTPWNTESVSGPE